MRTSAPDHLYLSLGRPYLASLQLLYALIGRYHIIRRSRHTAYIDNHFYPPDLLKLPTLGYCEISLRASSDPYYEVELIQSTTMNHETRFNKRSSTLEKRCFRIKNGEWSVWTMEEMAPGCHRVGVKLADLRLWEVSKPCPTNNRGELQVVHLSSRERVGMDGYRFVLGNFMMSFWLGARPCWQMKSQIGYQPDVAEVCLDEYWPMAS